MSKGMCMARGESAFTLFELALVLLVMSILAGAVVPDFVRSLRIEAAKKTALEMAQIAEAGRAYFIEKRGWPDGIAALGTGGFMDSAWEARNPFGTAYAIAVRGVDLHVTTSVPAGMAVVVASSLPMAVVTGLDVDMTVTPSGGSASTVAGTIIPWPSAAIPDGWFICDGRQVSRGAQAALFAVIGTVYGAGNGTSTFNLPDLRGRTVVGMDDMGAGAANVITDTRARSLGGRLGEEKHQLTAAEMPSHSHAYGQAFAGGAYDGHSSPLYNATRSASTSAAGGDQAHNNIQPSMAMYWIIKG